MQADSWWPQIKNNADNKKTFVWIGVGRGVGGGGVLGLKAIVFFKLLKYFNWRGHVPTRFGIHSLSGFVNWEIIKKYFGFCLQNFLAYKTDYIGHTSVHISFNTSTT